MYITRQKSDFLVQPILSTYIGVGRMVLRRSNWIYTHYYCAYTVYLLIVLQRMFWDTGIGSWLFLYSEPPINHYWFIQKLFLTWFSMGKIYSLKWWKWQAGGRLPKWYPFCTDKSSYSFQNRKFFLFFLQSNCTYIRDVHIKCTWILIFVTFCENNQLLNLVIFRRIHAQCHCCEFWIYWVAVKL